MECNDLNSVIIKPIIYGSTATYLNNKESEGEASYRWSLYVRGIDAEPLDAFIESVEFKIHESFEDNIRLVTSPPFYINEYGWGEFTARITINFKLNQDGYISSSPNSTFSFQQNAIPTLNKPLAYNSTGKNSEVSNFNYQTSKETFHNFTPSSAQDSSKNALQPENKQRKSKCLFHYLKLFPDPGSLTKSKVVISEVYDELVFINLDKKCKEKFFPTKNEIGLGEATESNSETRSKIVDSNSKRGKYKREEAFKGLDRLPEIANNEQKLLLKIAKEDEKVLGKIAKMKVRLEEKGLKFD